MQALRLTARRSVVTAEAQLASRRVGVRTASQTRWFSSEEQDKSKVEDSEKKPEGAAAADGAEKPSEPEKSDEMKALESKVEELEKEVAESKDKVLRAYAEMENVRQRSKREVENAQIYANQKFAKSLLEVADNLTRGLASVPPEALENAESNSHLVSLFEGIKMTETQLFKVFDANGIKAYGEVGDKFDPQLHEAMYQMDHPELEPGTVGMLMQRGYKFKDRVLRPAQVGTVKPK